MVKYNFDSCTFELSLSSLCELAARTGDIGQHRRAEQPPNADIYARIMANTVGYYSPEVCLQNTTLYDGMYYTVSGCADGVIRDGGELCADKVTCVRGYGFFSPPSGQCMAQLKCCAYFLAVREGLESVRGRVTYFNTDTKKIKYFNYSFSTAELKKYYIGLLEQVSFFAKLSVHRTLDVLPSAKDAVFPYSTLREGQELMIRECFGAIKRGQRLFVEAPTGTGKTISSVFPAVRALGHGHADKIFYLTAKASTRREAYAGAAKLFSSGTEIRTVVLNSKESMCRCDKRTREDARELCTPENCPLACGYYDRLNGALRELLSEANGYTGKLILAAAQKHGICPYELSLDLSEYCDLVICDYNYAFDPSVYLRRYFADGDRQEKYVFLVDEAHNLADRARDMYSASLKRAEFLFPESTEAHIFCIDILHAFEALRRLCRDSAAVGSDGVERGFFMSREPLGNFSAELENFRRKAEVWLKKNPESEYRDAVSALCSRVRKYLCVCDYFDKGFLCYVELIGEDITVKVFCLDPSRVMNRLLTRAVSSVLFSATLTPVEYFCDVLGCRKKSVTVSLPSPFPSERLCIAVADFLSVRYGDREGNILRFVSVIAATVSARAGNYIVYFPSYSCLEKVYGAFSAKYPHVSAVVQKKNMGQTEKEEFLSAFKADEGKLRVGFCVLGGAFSEGVDLPGSRLIGTVIFGVGLPGLSNERNIIKEYFDSDSGAGYDYAYTYPGMNNVLQAAGRVIRTENDRGIVVLVDDRYASPAYRRLFPKHWKNIKYAGNVASLAEISRRFWEKGDKSAEKC